MIKAVFVVLLSLFIQACATTSGPIHAYEGEQLDRKMVAKLEGRAIPSDGLLSLQQALFCGVGSKEFETATTELYLKPGVHELCVRYSVPKNGPLLDAINKRFDKKITVSVEAGQRYELKLEPVNKGIILSDVHFNLLNWDEEVVATSK